MNCLLFKLRFETPVHFGPPDSALSLYASEQTFYADMLFSALCHTALSLSGSAGVEQLCAWVREGKLRLSDAMPWRGDTLYLPKPYLSASAPQEVQSTLRKLIKKTRWVPVPAFGAFLRSLSGGTPYDPRQYATDFGQHVAMTRAAVPPDEDARPYSVGTFVFHADCGLYVLAHCASEVQSRLRELMEGLGKSGIGGKISSGYGRFSLVDSPINTADVRMLFDAMEATGERYLLLTTSLPRDDELDRVLADASFQLVRRGGFVQSDTFAPSARKKQTQVFLASGSVLSSRFEGDLYAVGEGGGHPVYRYSRPILLGVTL